MTERSDGTRKPNGRSSIFFSERDGKWHGYVTMGVKDDGSPDRRHRVGNSEPEVTKKVRELEGKRDAQKVDKPGRPPTVEAWMRTYLDDIAVRDLARNTLQSYWSDTRNWIIPHLGKHRLDRLQPEHLDKLYSRMYAADKKPSHVLKVHRILSRALEIAVRREKVGRNVAKLIDAPGSNDSEIEPLTQAEARRILAAADGRHNGVRWSVGLSLGLRQGEALGLRWKYVDLDGGAIKVWWQISRQKWLHGCDDVAACTEGKHRRPCPKKCAKAARKSGRRHTCVTAEAERLCPKICDRHASTCPKRAGGGLVFKKPKGKSRRTVPLPPELIPILKAHRTRQKAERLAAANVWEDHDLVFCQPNGRPIDPRRDWDDWKDILAEAEVRDARVHDGRHTAGTLLIEQGVHVRTVQEILGHSDIRLTQRYTHVATPMAEDGMQRIGRALWGS
ncbi:tyrosine-type recombinase/integrase [Spirillospora sp. NBC_01491]|uniref:tyrosine-type recombinase/integrase n=1 Tax=Spirillospora sp. NBC_01491 TaxID=2976007 RepID=UPI002E32E0DB|nr:tyrosine-type recombinase/integrase [Spirillospora sp. NBC_01491]